MRSSLRRGFGVLRSAADYRRGDPSPLLLDTARAIWPSASQLQVTWRGQSPSAAVDYLVLPSLAAPRWLLPINSPEAARALAGSESRFIRRASTRVLAMAQSGGVARALPLPRLRVVDTGDSLLSALGGSLGGDTSIAIRLGSWKHARTLVLRAFTADGATLAFGKVGIDSHGVKSVLAEARALGIVDRLSLSQMDIPKVLHTGAWRDLEFLLVSPLLPSATVIADDPPFRAMDELAHALGSQADELMHSQWWSDTVDRIQLVEDPALRGAFTDVMQRLEARGSADSIPLGLSHGDWTPWNMTATAGRLQLWDWEHFSEGVPVGFDHLHYLAQQLRVSSGTDVGAEREWRYRALELLGVRIGLGPQCSQSVIVSYLLNANLRFVLDRQSTPEEGVAREGWGLDLLRRESEDLGQGR